MIHDLLLNNERRSIKIVLNNKLSIDHLKIILPTHSESIESLLKNLNLNLSL
jgi:hypothetical protein